MNRISRAFQHLLTTTAAGRRAFPAAALDAIQNAIAAGESQHRAEVRLIVEPALTVAAIWHGVSARKRATELFAEYRIWDTEENSGVLIYINLADHKVEIVADRAVGRMVDDKDWAAICRTMTQGFARGAFHDSAVAGVSQLNAILARHFPANGTRPNQLPDQPIML